MLFSDKDLRNLLWPLVIEQVLVMLVGMVDTAMVSSVGETAVSGVALVDMVNYLVITVLTALTTGGAVCWCSAWGRQCCLESCLAGASSAFGWLWEWTGWPGPCASPGAAAKRAGATAAPLLNTVN